MLESDHQAMNDLQILRERGAPEALLAAIAASGLPAAAARAAVERISSINRLRRLFSPKARLSERELARLKAVATLAADVANDEGGADGAARFWGVEMPWLGGRTPAYWLARGDIGMIEDLRARINYGIPP